MSSQFNDSDDDVTLHTRRPTANSHSNEGRYDSEVADSRPADREVTLNTGVVLGLFFALALLCAVFFGFGYSIGHKSGVATAAATEPDTVAVADPAPTRDKPTPGSPAVATVPEYIPPSGVDRSAAPPSKPAAAAPATASPAPRPAAATPVVSPATVKPAPVIRTPPAAVAVAPAALSSTPAAPGSSYVQIAAVSHQEDADVLLSALRRRGYAVLTRSDPADKLIHVQVGPFSNRKEADSMRLKLAADGYNAFIK